MPVPSDLTAPAAVGARPVSTRLTESDRLLIRPNYPWFYVLYPDHPGNWFVATIEPGPGVADDEVGDWWLPKLQTEPVIPGVNHHRTLKRGQKAETMYDDAHQKISRDRGVVLPHDLGYIREVDCVDPRTQREGTYYLDVWSAPRKSRRGKRLKFAFDRQRYFRWLLRLIRDGVIAEPDEDIIAERVEIYARRPERRETDPMLSALGEDKRAEIIEAAKVEAAKVEAAKVPTVPETPTRRTRARKDADG